MSRFLITSALPYINGIKHLGNLGGSMLPADVHARFRRLQGHEVLFLCATDEHGTPAELAAFEAGMTVADYCAHEHSRQRALYASFGLSFDHFGRSSSQANRKLTQHFGDLLEDHGLIEARNSVQVFSRADSRFLPDRYIEGTCPHCGFSPARGDQCDNCGSLLDPVELINPRSKISGSNDLEIKDTCHLFLKQSKMQDEIKAWLDTCGHWSRLARSIAYKWLADGLNDRSITRDLEWGVPVTRHGHPRPGFESKVYYVWFDAPVEYIGAAVEWSEANGGDWRRWWRLDEGATDVNYLQFMGKDNVAFHAVSFPITLIGSREPWKLVDNLKAFNWINWYGQKFSTSERRGVFMDQALELLSADYWRWFLIRSSPEGSDTSFTWDLLQRTINADLANVIGNYVNRLWRFTLSGFNGLIPPLDQEGENERKIRSEFAATMERLTIAHETLEFRVAAAETRALWSICNEYLTLAAPWTTIKTSPVEAGSAVAFGLSLAREAARASLPIIPFTAEKILDALGESVHFWPKSDNSTFLAPLTAGSSLPAMPILFRRIEDTDVREFENRFPQ